MTSEQKMTPGSKKLHITGALSYHQGTFISPGHFHIRDSTYILFARQVLRVLPVNLYIEDNRSMFDTASDATWPLTSV